MSLRYRIARTIRNLASWIEPRTRGMGWTCFHCGENFGNPNLAQAHFGDTPGAAPACVLIQDRGMLYELREAQRERAEALQRAKAAEDQAEVLEGEMDEFKRAARAANSHELRMAIDSLTGRAICADVLIEAVRAKAPEIYAEVIG